MQSELYVEMKILNITTSAIHDIENTGGSRANEQAVGRDAWSKQPVRTRAGPEGNVFPMAISVGPGPGPGPGDIFFGNSSVKISWFPILVNICFSTTVEDF